MKIDDLIIPKRRLPFKDHDSAVAELQARSLLSRGVAPGTVAAITGLSLDRVNQIAADDFRGN